MLRRAPEFSDPGSRKIECENIRLPQSALALWITDTYFLGTATAIAQSANASRNSDRRAITQLPYPKPQRRYESLIPNTKLANHPWRVQFLRISMNSNL